MKKIAVLALLCFLPMHLLTLNAQTGPDLTGSWKGSAILNTGEADPLDIVFKRVDGTLTGVVNDEFGMVQNASMRNLTIKGNTISFMLEVVDGNEIMDISLKGEITGSAIKGTWSDDYSGTSSTWKIEKVVDEEMPLTGVWEGHAILDNGELDPLAITFTHKDGKMSGTVTDEFGLLTNSPLINLKLKGNKVTFSLEIEDQSGFVDVNLRGIIEGSKITGEWVDPVNRSGNTWEVTHRKEEETE